MPTGRPIRTTRVLREMRRIVVAGASRGIGSAVAAHYAAKGDEVLSLSRGEARSGRWLKCDLSQPGEIAAMAGQIGGRIDALLFAGGVWEAGAFNDAYSFAASPPEETAMVLAVNLAAPILLTQALLPLMSDGARVVVIGSLSGLDNTATVEVANSASKYGLRGAAHALALSLQPQGHWRDGDQPHQHRHRGGSDGHCRGAVRRSGADSDCRSAGRLRLCPRPVTRQPGV